MQPQPTREAASIQLVSRGLNNARESRWWAGPDSADQIVPDQPRPEMIVPDQPRF